MDSQCNAMLLLFHEIKTDLHYIFHYRLYFQHCKKTCITCATLQTYPELGWNENNTNMSGQMTKMCSKYLTACRSTSWGLIVKKKKKKNIQFSLINTFLYFYSSFYKIIGTISTPSFKYPVFLLTNCTLHIENKSFFLCLPFKKDETEH